MVKNSYYYSCLAKNIKPTLPPLIKGEKTKVWDINGKEYLDFSSQTLNLNLGHCNPRIINEVKKQLDLIHYTSSRFFDVPSLKLSNKLIEISPSGFEKVNIKMTGGSEANECALKMVRKYHDKNTIISLYNSFFGETFETMRCGGRYFNNPFIGSKTDYVFISPPYCFRCPYNAEVSNCNLECAYQFKKVVEIRKDIAGIIIEPIIVNAGVIIPPRDYLIFIRNVCDEFGITLIFDEVQTAFGWLGEMFASNYFDVIPDIMTLAKGLSAGFPLGAVLFKEEYDILEYGEHEFTYGAHPISCVAALETINILTENNCLKNVKKKGLYFENRLLELKEEFNCIGDIRSIGLLAGIEIIHENGSQDFLKAKKMYDYCLNKGVLFRLSNGFAGNVIIIKPPLVVNEDEIDIAVNTLRESIKECS